jgi:hypothetical protein
MLTAFGEEVLRIPKEGAQPNFSQTRHVSRREIPGPCASLTCLLLPPLSRPSSLAASSPPLLFLLGSFHIILGQNVEPRGAEHGHLARHDAGFVVVLRRRRYYPAHATLLISLSYLGLFHLERETYHIQWPARSRSTTPRRSSTSG